MFYFAYQADGNSVFGPAMHRVDDNVYSFRVSHSEGDFARLEIEIINPRVGLLTPTRKQWIWLAWRKPDASVVPLFHGRIVGVPEQMGGELVKLVYVARAPDSDEQKRDLAQSLRVLPFFDPVFIDPTLIQEPDTVLEARSALWHFGRTDKTVTISDIVNGEAGTVALDEGDAFDVDVNISGDPLRSVNVTAEVNWKQAATGVVNVTAPLIAAFAAAGSSGPVTSFTGQGLEANWLLAGDQIGGGWSVEATTLKLLSSFVNGITPEFVDVPIAPAGPPPGPPDFFPTPDLGGATVDPTSRARFYLWTFASTLQLRYLAARDRTETISFTLHADVQDLLTEPETPRSIDMQFQSGLVGAEVDDADAGDDTFTGEDLPIGLISRRSYFNLPRGKRSVEFLILCARARLLMSARAAQITAQIEFGQAVGLSCRKNVLLTDRRIPGGQAQGKVIGYSFGLDGDKGELVGQVGLGCTIGRGNVLAPLADGAPAYAEAEAMGADLQEFTASEALAVAGPVGGVKYQKFSMPVVDDGINFSNMTAAANILSLSVVNGETVQRAALAAEQPDLQTASDVLNAVATLVRLNLRPVTGGPFRADRQVQCSQLVIPRYLDLEAA